MNRDWRYIKLHQILTPVDRAETPLPGKAYRQIGVKLWGEGAYERECIDGSQTKYAKLYRGEADDIIVNKIWARNGSVAVIPEVLAGCYGSGEFPMFMPNRQLLEPRWFHWLTKTRGFWAQCEEKSRGSSGKNRIRPERFLDIEIRLPTLPEQRHLAVSIDELATKIAESKKTSEIQSQEMRRMLISAFRLITKEAPTRPMKEVAPLVRRPIVVDPSKPYLEIGIRSFGKGTFHKPPVTGADIGEKRVFQIEHEDLLFSNVFAWEGAIAVAKRSGSVVSQCRRLRRPIRPPPLQAATPSRSRS